MHVPACLAPFSLSRNHVNPKDAVNKQGCPSVYGAHVTFEGVEPMKRLFFRALLATSILTLSISYLGCATASTKQNATRVLDPDADDGLGGTGTESSDIRTIGERMSREIIGISWPESAEAPRIAVIPIVNQTRFRVDPKLLQNKLLKSLVTHAKGKVTFLARTVKRPLWPSVKRNVQACTTKGKVQQPCLGQIIFSKEKCARFQKQQQRSE